MQLVVGIPDEVLAKAIAQTLVGRREGQRAVDEALQRLGPAFDAIVLEVAKGMVEEAARKEIGEIVASRARRMTQKGQPLKAQVDKAVQRAVQQLKLGVEG